MRVVIAESYERIHRSNLVGMGILPLQFLPGETAASLGLTGEEVFETVGLPQLLDSAFAGGRDVEVRAMRSDGRQVTFKTLVRIDTPQEIAYYQHGGILQYVLRAGAPPGGPPPLLRPPVAGTAPPPPPCPAPPRQAGRGRAGRRESLPPRGWLTRRPATSCRSRR